MMTLGYLAERAAEVERELVAAGFTERPALRQGLALAEEAGEAVAAIRRWAGLARRRGTLLEVEQELADVVITAFVTAEAVGINLPTAVERKLSEIFARGWREGAP